MASQQSSNQQQSAGQAGAGSQRYYELYRKSSIGVALMDSLDELIQSGHIMPALALKILMQFDKSTAHALQNQSKPTKCLTKGHLRSYNNCDDVWTFVLNDATFRLDGNESLGPLDKVKIVACRGDGGPPGSK